MAHKFTSKGIAKKSAKILTSKALPKFKSVAGSALAQAKPKAKKPKKGK